MRNAVLREEGATIFGYHVSNPFEFGLVEFDKDSNAVSIEEKPLKPKSNFTVPGLFFYDNDVVEIAKNLKPSYRGEIEITAFNNEYLRRGKFKVKLFGRRMVWLDTGTHWGLLNAANFIEDAQTRQWLYVSYIKEITFRKGFIDNEHLIRLVKPLSKIDYGKYLLNFARQNIQASKEAATT